MASSATLREFAKQASARSRETVDATTLNDRVEISELASFLSRLAELPDDRARKIVEVRNAIANNSYETQDKHDIATERFLDELSVKSTSAAGGRRYGAAEL